MQEECIYLCIKVAKQIMKAGTFLVKSMPLEHILTLESLNSAETHSNLKSVWFFKCRNGYTCAL